MKNRWNNITELVGRLNSLLWKQRASQALAGVTLTIAVIVLAGSALALIAAQSILPVWAKLSLLALLVGLFFALTFRRILAPLRGGAVESIAAALEKSFGELKGRLVAAVQFNQDSNSLPAGTSPELVDLTARQTLEIAADLELGNALDHSLWRRTIRPAAAAAVVFALTLVFAPGYFSHAWEVYSQPLSVVAPPLGYQLSSTPGVSKAIKYRDLELAGHLSGVDFPREAEIHYRFSGGRWQAEKFDLRKFQLHPMENYDSLAFRARLREVKRSLEYYVTAGARQTEVRAIEIVDLPRITDIDVSIVAPSYTGLPPAQLEDNSGSFAAIVGSRARILAESNSPLVSSEIRFDDESVITLSQSGVTLSADITVNEDRAYHFYLVDSLGEKNPDPIDYYITAIEDRIPEVTVVTPGADVDIDESMLLPLKAQISDDFGFSSLALKYTVTSGSRESDETVMVIHYSDNITTEGEIAFTWDLEKVDIQPGDFITYYFEVYDNDEISGPKKGVSRVYQARLPSVDEMIAELDKESEERIDATERILRQERDLNERLKDTQRKLDEMRDQNKKPDWQKQRTLEELSQQHQELTKQIDKLAEEMNRSLQERQSSALMNQEMLEKLKRIQELFEEVATDEMREAQKKLDEALKEMDREKLDDAMEDFELSQEEMLDRLERTLELLKQLQIEQKINAMTEAAKELLDKQVENNEETEGAQEEELAELAPEEDKVTEGLEKLKEQAKELKEMLDDSEKQSTPEAQEFADIVEKNDAGENTEEMSDQLKQGQKSEASKSGEKAEQKLKSMLDQMRQQQQAMSGQQSSQMNAALRRAIEDATYLSREQEGLLNESSSLNPRSTALRDLAQEQSGLKESVAGFGDRLVRLSQKNPFLSSELRTLVSDALYQIDESVESLHETRGAPAQTSQRDAMKSLNDIALKLLESMEQQQQCNKGGSCDKAGQRMESLGEKQSKLNRDTKRQMNNHGPSDPGNAERLRELAGEQEAIRRSLQDLQRELGNRDEILGDLDAIQREMKKVIEEMSNGEAGPETSERQLRIYSRLLESTKALNRRDFTQERQARVGEDFFRSSPPGFGSEDDDRPFEDRLQEFLKEGFPPEYEEQVRNYFKALNNLNSQNNPER